MNAKKYKQFVLSQGCIVTGEIGPHIVPHHPKCFNSGWGQVSDWFVIPLASRLHTQQGDSVHQNKPLFEDRYGREMDLLSKTIERAVSQLNNERVPF